MEAIRVTPRDFITAWQRSNSVAEVSRKTGLSKNAVRTRACRYRQLGVPLKQFPAIVVEPTDWDELAEFAESLLESLADESDAV
jgi:hypothetical protein